MIDDDSQQLKKIAINYYAQASDRFGRALMNMLTAHYSTRHIYKHIAPPLAHSLIKKTRQFPARVHEATNLNGMLVLLKF